MQVNVLITSPFWIDLKTRIIQALAAFPEAKGAVLVAITEAHHANQSTGG
jgi:hypothetical protein